MLQPIERRSLAASVFEQLRDHIVSGSIEIGASLPAERALAERLGVNRAAVREGLKRLEQAGLVRIHHGGGTFVRDYRRSAGLELLGALIVRSDGSIDTGVARGVVELRSMFAPMVAQLAAERALAADCDRIEAAVCRMNGVLDDTPALVRASFDFWAGVVDATRNLSLGLTFNSLLSVYDVALQPLAEVIAVEVRAVDDYAAMAAAIRKGQVRSASRLATRIVQRGAAAMEPLFAAVDAAQGAAGGTR